MTPRLHLAAMVPRFVLSALAALALAAVFATPQAKADQVTFQDCRRCIDTGGWLNQDMTCQYPDSGYQAKLGCRQATDISGYHQCWDGVTPCEYDCFGPGCDGGGYGGGGGGGGGSCGGGAYCPPECFSCGGNAY